MDICVVGVNDKQKVAKWWRIATNKKGWVPFFNMATKNAEIRVAKIPIEWFGKQIDEDIFEPHLK